MKIIDTHCHLDADEFAGARELIIRNAEKVGVCGYIVPGIHPDNWARLDDIASRFNGAYIAPGVHPLFLDGLAIEETIKALERQLMSPKVVAAGEIGLDLYTSQDNLDKQLPFFIAQVELAIFLHLPLILHIRKAHDIVLSILRKSHYSQKGNRGIVHAYGGSLQQAQQYYDMGFSLGIGGMICNPKARKIRAIVTQMPLDAFVLETDAPYMKILPDALGRVTQCIAELRKEKIDSVTQTIHNNTCNIFNKLQEKIYI